MRGRHTLGRTRVLEQCLIEDGGCHGSQGRDRGLVSRRFRFTGWKGRKEKRRTRGKRREKRKKRVGRWPLMEVELDDQMEIAGVVLSYRLSCLCLGTLGTLKATPT